jgi:hypothetical protein
MVEAELWLNKQAVAANQVHQDWATVVMLDEVGTVTITQGHQGSTNS